MRRDPDHFGERPLDLLFIGRKVKESVAVEELLAGAGIDYLVEVDYYVGGLIFRSERAGAFIYVEEPALDAACQLLRANGHRPQPDNQR